MKNIIFFFLGILTFTLNAQTVQDFNKPVRFNSVAISPTATVDYIYTVGSNGIMTKISKDSLGNLSEVPNLDAVLESGNTATNKNIVLTDPDNDEQISYNTGSITYQNIGDTPGSVSLQFPMGVTGNYNAMFQAESGTVAYLSDISQSYLNVKDFGAIGNGIADDSDAIIDALQEAKTGNIKRVYLPQGTYAISKTLYIPSNVEFFGDGQELTTIINNAGADAGLDVIGVLENTPSDSFFWKTMISTENASYEDEDIDKNIKIHSLGVDWNNIDVQTNSALPILIGKSENVWVEDVKIYDALSDDLIGEAKHQGKNIMFAFSKDSGLKNSWIGDADYESVSAWYLSENILIDNNVFYIDKPLTYENSSHAIQIARPTPAVTELLELFGRVETRNVTIQNNTFYLKQNIRQGITSHVVDGMNINNNVIKILDGFDGFIYAIKPFDDSKNINISGNIIDFRDYNANQYGSSAISIGTSVVESGKIIHNIRIDNNTVLVKNLDPVSGSVTIPNSSLIGGFLGTAVNSSITNNTISIDGYDNTPSTIIGASGTGVNVSGNVVTLSNPFVTIDGTGLILFRTRGGSDITFENNTVNGDLSRGIQIDDTVLGLTDFLEGGNNFASIGSRFNNLTASTSIKHGVLSIEGNFADSNGDINLVSDITIGSINEITISGADGITNETLLSNSGTNDYLQRGNVTSLISAIGVNNLSDVTDYTTGNTFAVVNSGATGVGFRTIIGADVGLTTGGLGARIPAYNTTTNAWVSQGYDISSSGGNSTILIRTSLGRAVFNDAVNNNEGVTLGQVNTSLALKANLANPTFTGNVVVPTADANTEAVNLLQMNNALDLKAPLANPTFTGNAIIPTATFNDPTNGVSSLKKIVVNSTDQNIEFTKGTPSANYTIKLKVEDVSPGSITTGSAILKNSTSDEYIAYQSYVDNYTTSTTYTTSADLETDYPDVRLGTEVINETADVIYKKTGASTWSTITITAQLP